MKNFFIFTFSIFPILLISEVSNSYSLTPMVAELSPVGAESSKSFTVQNPSENNVALQVSVFKRAIDINGKETREKTEHFKFYPEQFVLKGKEFRTIRLTYVGPKEILEEASYRLVVEQLPVELKKVEKTAKKIDLNFTLSFVASVYVTPANASPRLQAEEINLTSTGIDMTLNNLGKAHIVLKDIEKITFFIKASDLKIPIEKKSNDKMPQEETVKLEEVDEHTFKFKLSDSDLKSIEGENILAQSKRKIVLKLSKKLNANKIEKAEVSINR